MVKDSVAFAEKLMVEVRDWVTLIVAGIALVGVACSTAQKRLADNRDQWWKRTQWALERILLEDQASKVVGYGVLDVLIQSRRVGTEEFNMLLAVTEVDLEMIDSEAVDSADAGEGTG